MAIQLSPGPVGHGASEASPAELKLGQAAAAHGWPVADSKTEYWTSSTEPTVSVHGDHGIVHLVATGDGMFRVASFASRKAGASYSNGGLPDDTKQANLSYRQFLALVEEHGLHDRERLRRLMTE